MVNWKFICGSMRILGFLWIAVLVLSAGCAAQKGPDAAASEKSVKISGVRVETEDNLDRVIIETEPESVDFNVSKWTDPARIVLDFEGAFSDNPQSTIPVADGCIQEVEIKEMAADSESSSSLVRVIINMEKNSQYEVNREVSGLSVNVSKDDGLADSSNLFGEIIASSDSEDDNQLAQWAWGGPAAADESADDNANVQFPAKNLKSIVVQDDGDLTRVKIIADGKIGDYSAFTLENPDRLVMDIWGLGNSAKIARKLVNQQGITRVRAGEHPDKMRLVFDSKDKLPHYRFDKSGSELVVSFSETMDVSASPEISLAAETETAAIAAEEIATVPAVEPVEVEEGIVIPEAPVTSDSEWKVMEVAQAEWSGPAAVEEETATPVSAPLDWGTAVTVPAKDDGKAGIAYIDSVKFDYTNDSSSIVIHSDREIRREVWSREDNPEEKIITFFIENAQVNADQQRSYDTSEFQSPIEIFSVFQKPNVPNEVAIVVVMRSWAASKWNQYGKKLVLQFENYPGSLGLGGGPTAGSFGPRGEEITSGEVPGVQDQFGPIDISSSAPGTSQYTGATISLDLKGMDIMDALRTIAEISGMNMVVADNVTGKVTLKLDNVPWDQALDIILDSKDLGKVEKGNIIRIAPAKQLAEERKRIQKEIIAGRKFEQLTTRIIPVNYLKAQDMKKIVKPILTKGRGRVDNDKSTNTLVIRDVKAIVDEAYRLVSTLDKPFKQVLIEARMVEATVGVTRDIGVTWGAQSTWSPLTGNPTGLDFPNTVQVGGATLGGISEAFNAAGALSDGGGAMGLSLGHLNNAINLDVALKALEAQEKIKIISSPRVLTVSDAKAVIQQGVSIPYAPPSLTTGSSGGWLFIEATLRLDVTPHVAPDNSIILTVKAQNNEPTTVAGGSAPAINKKEAKTTILLQNGETAVIGGIFKITKSTPVTQVPFLGNLPVIGRLFKLTSNQERNEELIIFLTPHIVEPGKGIADSLVSSGMNSGIR